MDTIITIRPVNIIQIRPDIQTIQPIVIRPKAAVSVRPSSSAPAVIRPAVTVRVEPPKRGAWAERGWRSRVDGRMHVYEGDYQVGRRSFRGRVQIDARSGKITAYIHNPPPEIKRHPHGACFQQYGIGSGWFILHWRRPARNVDDAILYMERVLDESLR